MRLGLIADIHGDLRALEAALRRLEELGVDQVLCCRRPGRLWQRPRRRRGPDPELGDPLRPGQPRPLGPRAAAALRSAGMEAGRAARRDLGVPGRCPRACGSIMPVANDRGPPRLARQRHRYVTAYKPMPASVEQFWDQSDAGPDPGPYPHPDDRTRSPRDGHQPRLGPRRAGLQTSYTFAVLDTVTARSGFTRYGPAGRSAVTPSTSMRCDIATSSPAAFRRPLVVNL